MARTTRKTLIANEGGLGGRVAGATLAAIRRELGLSQEDLAYLLDVGQKTVAAWERGRNPLTHLPFDFLRRLGRVLLARGARADLVAALETALAADDILSGLGATDPDQHPLGLTVPDRATTDMLTWPLTGTVPRQLRETSAALHIPPGQRAEAAAGLRTLAESAGEGERAAMLRRQAVFLVAEHDAAAPAGAAQGWAAEQIREDVRRTDLRAWSPKWAVARSAAVRAASAGDPDPLHRFVQEGLGNAETEAANLRYWAYWVGESPAPWASDAEMARPESDAWSGELLLPSLLAGVTGAPYRELCAHSLWTLARARRSLITRPQWIGPISTAIEAATCDETLSTSARQRLGQVHYLIGSTE